MADARRTFAPVLLLGLASAALASVAASKPMARVDPGWLDDRDLRGMVEAQVERVGGDELPLAAALALVLLAAWGVLLVTRGRVRRMVAVVAVVAALGVVGATWFGFPGLEDALREDLAPMFGAHDDADSAPIEHTAWFWTLLAAGLVAVLASAAAVRWAPSWPEMGSRYDAPAGSATTERPASEQGEQSNIDLWKSLDEGNDPTA